MILVLIIIGIIISSFSLQLENNISCESNGSNIIVPSDDFTVESVHTIYGFSYVYSYCGFQDEKEYLNWQFSSNRHPIDVWLFNDYNYDRFSDGYSAVGYNLCDYEDGYVSASGHFRFTTYDEWYLVYCNNYLTSTIVDIQASITHIMAEIVSVTYTAIDVDDDTYTDRISVDCEFDFNVPVADTVSVTITLYDSNDDLIEEVLTNCYIPPIGYGDCDGFFGYNVNEVNEYVDEYYAKVEVFYYFSLSADDTLTKSETITIYPYGHKRTLIMNYIKIGGLVVAGIAVAIIVPVIIVRVVKKRKVTPSTETFQTIAPAAPVIGAAEIPPLKPIKTIQPINVFCLACGSKLTDNTKFCSNCGAPVSNP